MEITTLSSRRAMLGMALAMPIAATVAAVPIGLAGTLSARIEAFRRETERMNRGRYSDAVWSDWQARQNALVAEVRRLPLTPEHAAIRAHMALTVMMEDPALFEEMADNPEGILAVEIIRSLAGKAVRS